MPPPNDKASSIEAAKQAKPSLTPKKGATNLAASLKPEAMKQVQGAVIEDTFAYPTALQLAIVGAGQGGSRIANAFWDLGYRRVGAFNTTATDFEGLADDMPKVSLDIGGAAKDLRLARNAVVNRSEDAWDLFQRAWGNKFECALICAGLGGGSGSGSIIPLIDMARQYMRTKNLPERVGAIVSLPGVDEGQKTAGNAVTAFKELVEAKVSPLIVIDNDKVHDLYSPAIADLLPRSNFLVSNLLHLFNRLGAARSRHITFDKSEFTQLMDGGIVVMGSADLPPSEVKQPADVSKQIRDQLANSVLADVDLRTGKKAACIFVASPDVLNTFGKDHFAAGFTQLNRIVGQGRDPEKPTVVHRGIYETKDLYEAGDAETTESSLQCYTLISELAPPTTKLQALAREAGLSSNAVPVSPIARHFGVD